ncbi:MAG: hypothetical protein H5T45_07150 [Thermoplasmatales archaeon]|nr:hypothetical protein [Thermoplasmatales archaeon]
MKEKRNVGGDEMTADEMCEIHKIILTDNFVEVYVIGRKKKIIFTNEQLKEQGIDKFDLLNYPHEYYIIPLGKKTYCIKKKCPHK